MTGRVLFGDCRASMRQLIADGVRAQMCVTSPPYWGLRDYGTGEWIGGSTDCDHLRKTGGTAHSTLANYPNGLTRDAIEGTNRAQCVPFSGQCRKCGAVRVDQQLGIEASPDEYIANMVEVFGLVRELLADDGVLWLNIGDSYAGAPGGGQGKNGQRADRSFTGRIDVDKVTGELKPKDLVGIPWMLAFALRTNGWHLRQDIIWHKPNPMPESVTDRCTKSHEYLFLLSKSRKYYWDAAAMQERAVYGEHPRSTSYVRETPGQNPQKGLHPANDLEAGSRGTRNRRSVWSVQTQPYSGAHFAVFPPALIEPCILTTSRPGDVVLDPFFGSGTTGQVAQDLGRDWIGCELNCDYESLQRERTAQGALEL